MWGTICFWLSIGYSLKRFKWNETRLKRILSSHFFILVHIVLYMLLVYWFLTNRDSSSISFYTYGESLIWYLILSILGTTVQINLAFKIKKIRFMVALGQNTLVFYGLHGKIESLFEAVVLRFGYELATWEAVMVSVLGVVVVYIFLMPFSYFLNVYIPALVGKGGT